MTKQLTILFPAVGREKSLRKNCKTWKTIRPRSTINCYKDKKQLD